jgi:hypothetical protein
LFTSEGALDVGAAVTGYLGAGVPADKIVMGVRFVGIGWQGVGSANNGLHQTDTGPAPDTWDQPGSPPSGSFGYQDIEDNYLPSYTRSWDDEAQVPWLYNADTGIMISYEDPESLTAKANYMLSKQLGGIMIWELAADDDQDTLVNAIARGVAVMSLPEQTAAAAESIVNTLTQTDYQHVDKIDPATGVYDCDCKGFVGFVLTAVAPRHFALIPEETDQPRPRAFEYFDFFASLTPESTGGWRRIDFLSDARRGDIMAWRFPTIEPDENTGHVVIVAETPSLDASGDFFVMRVYDSAEEAHFDDTREPDGQPSPTGTTGVGSGFINFKVDGAGRPIAYLFAPPITADYEYRPIAIGRAEPF